MQNRYNLDNLVAEFRHSLEIENFSSVTVKNYQSDLRHFIGWALFASESQGQKIEGESFQGFIQFITPMLIADYKSYLLNNQTPQKTVSRRLSTMRKFCTFCIHQGWMQENPAKHIVNAPPSKPSANLEDIDSIISAYRKSLASSIPDLSAQNQQYTDVAEFVSIINSRF
ncbi:hypothetical protein COY90_02020 [Candidatus Roizmanbacteria bacterium CG_4_10_14_0_8_um_filter_39_9]|uniref:Core-binding (CB) domain-containing protein n=1 Tax=Candidatus Roizmanbacteria bacterium CG_4_10_14_0_8_um_filter_39_9 TaxID=1974829 RepID=A0A2M7QD91_9BACT|nr:MAG: hypothetical protein COY90_02020 [Candidatus Roizmanbacteria bacterium CG_4_10_14_0_8_um_filter_39_9]